MLAEALCTAILLLPGVDKAECQRANSALFNADAETWNSTTCEPNVLQLERNGYRFERAADSGNLVWESCEWEVRAVLANTPEN